MNDKNLLNNAKSRFSIRKTTLGVGSVLLGFTLMGNVAQAEEVSTGEKLEFLATEDVFEETVEDVSEEAGKDLEVEGISFEASVFSEGDFDKFDTVDTLEEPAKITAPSKPLSEIKADDNIKGVYKDGSDVIVANVLNTNVGGESNTTVTRARRDIIFVFDTSGSMGKYHQENSNTRHVVNIYDKIVAEMSDDDTMTILPVFTNNNANVPPSKKLTKTEARSAFNTMKSDPNYFSTQGYDFSLRNPGFTSEPLTGTTNTTVYFDSNHGDLVKGVDSESVLTPEYGYDFKRETTYGIWIVDDWTVAGTDAVDGTLSSWLRSNTSKLISYAYTKDLNAEHRKLPNIIAINDGNNLTDDQVAESINAEISENTTVTYKPITVNVDTKGLNVESMVLIKPDGSKTPIQNGSTFTPDSDGEYKVRYILKGTEPNATTTYTGKLTSDGSELNKKEDTANIHVPVVENNQETETEPVPFTKETRNNPLLKKGETKIVQQGKEGIKTIYYEVTVTDGQRGERRKLREEITTQPTPEITEVGTQSTKERTETQKVPNKTVTKKTFDLMKGQTREDKGSEGVRTIIYTEVYDGDRKVSESVKSDTVTVDPVDTVIWEGTKEFKERVETQSVPNRTIEKRDFSLMVGERKEIKGSEGIRTIVYEETYDDGNKVSEAIKSDRVTKDPVDTVILIGTKEIRERTVVTPVPNKVVEKKDFSMIKGERKEIIGHLGIRTAVYVDVFDDGAKVSETVKSDEITLSPVDTIILIGTKEIKQRVETQPVPFKRITKKTADLLVGDVRIFKGHEGVRTIIHEEIYDEDRLDSTKVISDEITTPAKDEIEWVGVKEFKHRNERIAVAYESEVVENPDLPKGELRLVQTGVDGYEIVHYQETWVDGKLVKTEETKRERVEPITEIKELGTKEPEPEVHEPEECPMPVGELPKAGEQDTAILMGIAGLSVAAGVGLAVTNRRKAEK